MGDSTASGLVPPVIVKDCAGPLSPDAVEIKQLTAFFSWAAWACAVLRPDAPYSYTNNWPADTLAGNEPTAQALLWSVLSLAALLGG